MNPNAKVTAYNKPLPYVYIENMYTEKELGLIYQELDFYKQTKILFLLAILKQLKVQEILKDNIKRKMVVSLCRTSINLV